MTPRKLGTIIVIAIASAMVLFVLTMLILNVQTL